MMKSGKYLKRILNSRLKLTGFVLLAVFAQTFAQSYNDSERIPNKVLYNAEQYHQKKILYLNSYHKGFHWSDRIMKAIFDGLQHDPKYEFYMEYMDTKRHAGEGYFEQLKEIYKYKYQHDQIDFVLSSDDNALKFLLTYRDSLFPGVPVVFCGINHFNDSILSGQRNITGIHEQYNVIGTIDLILKHYPATNKVAFILDHSISGKAIHNRIKLDEAYFKGKLEFQYLVDLPKDSLARVLEKLPEETAVVYGIYLRIDDEQVFDNYESVQWITQHSKKPVYTIWDVVGMGVLGGYVIKPYDHGSALVQIMKRIENGERPEDIPIVASPLVMKMDYNVLKQYGFNEKAKENEVIIINKPNGFYQQHKLLFWSVLIVVSVLAFMVAVLIALFRQSQRRGSELKQKNLELAETTGQLKITNLELEKAIEKAEEHSRLRSAFLANMSHEIRTPMNGILGFTQLLWENEQLAEQNKRYVEIIMKSGERMLNTINDILNISKLQAGQENVAYSDIDLVVVIEEIFLFFKPEAERKALILNLEFDIPAESLPMRTDKSKLDSIITNLVKNALKFTDKGSIRVLVSKIGQSVQFVVSDTGIGIPKNKIDIIFDPFVQGDIDDKDAKQGTGLGLAITRSYVEMLGGTIRLHSVQGEGAKFTVTLPLQPVEESEQHAQELKISN